MEIRRAIWLATPAAILLLTLLSTSQAQEVGDPTAGAEVFRKCMACHRVGPSAKNSVGPVLNGIVGRESGVYPDYRYSSAMKNSHLVWDSATLAKYLKAPKEVVPGNKMAFVGLRDPAEVANVIAYLSKFDERGNEK